MTDIIFLYRLFAALVCGLAIIGGIAMFLDLFIQTTKFNDGGKYE